MIMPHNPDPGAPTPIFRECAEECWKVAMALDKEASQNTFASGAAREEFEHILQRRDRFAHMAQHFRALAEKESQ
jgi:hypothetical protein